MTPLDEPLLESAPLAFRIAPRLCRRDPATGENCAWYHGIWQYLRIMGLASSAAQRAEFYQRSIQSACAGSRAPRVLISGAADYAMTALVLASVRDRGTAIVVMDICETPLHLSRWYAERESRAVETVCGDILDLRTSAPFDVICTDGFFSRLPATRRPVLVAKWRELLRPGGRVITTNRLHPGSSGEKTGFSPARAQAFRDKVRRAISNQRDAIRVDPEELARLADLYAARHDTYPLTSMDEIRSLCEGAGFGVDSLSAVSRGPGHEDGAARPAPKKPVMQMHLVAVRF